MGILQNIFHAMHPPCAHCPYRLGLIRFVQSPCPACIMYGYRMYDELTCGRRHILGLGWMMDFKNRGDGTYARYHHRS